MRKPRLLSLNTYNYRRGGADAAFLENDRLFTSLGWETAVFTMRHPKNEASPWDEYFVDEIEFGSDYNLWQRLVMAGKVVYSIEARKKLARLLNKHKPDIAHAHCIYHHLSPSVLSLLHERGIPTVMTAHDLKLACPAYKMLNGGGVCEKCKGGNLLNVAMNRCIHGSLTVSALIMIESSVHKIFGLYRNNLDSVVVPSRFYARKLAEWGWPEDKLVYIPNYIHTDALVPRYKPGDYFLYFGRLAPEKGVDTLIKAAREVDVKLKIVGTGPYEKELHELAGDASGVEFLGHCSGETLWTLVREARAVVLPSQWYENAPLSLLEAYASGKIVIGARIGGITEMVLPDDTGFLFESGSVDDLAKVIELVASIPDNKIERMGRSARKYVSSTFTQARYVASMSELYRSLGVPLRGSESIVKP